MRIGLTRADIASVPDVEEEPTMGDADGLKVKDTA
jgi:hypothetical protein